jgi:hypothetical protein
MMSWLKNSLASTSDTSTANATGGSSPPEDGRGGMEDVDGLFGDLEVKAPKDAPAMPSESEKHPNAAASASGMSAFSFMAQPSTPAKAPNHNPGASPGKESPGSSGFGFMTPGPTTPLPTIPSPTPDPPAPVDAPVATELGAGSLAIARHSSAKKKSRAKRVGYGRQDAGATGLADSHLDLQQQAAVLEASAAPPSTPPAAYVSAMRSVSASAERLPSPVISSPTMTSSREVNEATTILPSSPPPASSKDPEVAETSLPTHSRQESLSSMSGKEEAEHVWEKEELDGEDHFDSGNLHVKLSEQARLPHAGIGHAAPPPDEKAVPVAENVSHGVPPLSEPAAHALENMHAAARDDGPELREVSSAASRWAAQVALLCSQLSEATRRHAEMKMVMAEASEALNHRTRDVLATEAAQVALAEAEDYEGADNLNAVIESHRRACEESSSKLETLKATRETLVGDKLLYREQLLLALSDGRATMEEAVAKVAAQAESVSASALAQAEIATKRAQEEQQRIELERGHVARDMQHLEEERAQLEESIAAQTSDEAARREELELQRLELDGEIKQLLSSLEKKREQLADIEVKLGEAEGKIGQVRRKFERQQARLRERERLIAVSIADCDAEAALLAKEVEALERARYEATDAERTAAKGVERAAKELSVSAALKAALSAHWAQEVTRAAAPALDENAEVRIAMEAAEAAVAEAEAATAAAAEARSMLEMEAASLDAQVPELESSKRAAVAARDYKEAGAVSKQLKLVEARRSEVQAALATDSSDELAADLARRKERAARAAAALLHAQRDRDISRLKKLSGASAALRRAIDGQISKTSSCSESALLSSLSGLLSEELEATDTEALAIAEIHGLNIADFAVQLPEDDHAMEEVETTADSTAADDTDVTSTAAAVPAVNATGIGKSGTLEEEEGHGRAAMEPFTSADMQVEGQLVTMRAEMESLSIQLEAAVEAEDFDLAERLDECIRELAIAMANHEGQHAHEEVQSAQMVANEEGEREILGSSSTVELGSAMVPASPELSAEDQNNNSEDVGPPEATAAGIGGVREPEEHGQSEADADPEMPEASSVTDDDSAIATSSLVPQPEDAGELYSVPPEGPESEPSHSGFSFLSAPGADPEALPETTASGCAAANIPTPEADTPSASDTAADSAGPNEAASGRVEEEDAILHTASAAIASAVEEDFPAQAERGTAFEETDATDDERHNNFVRGETCLYVTSEGELQHALILGVHYDDELVPFYTIKMEETGVEKNTTGSRLLPL